MNPVQKKITAVSTLLLLSAAVSMLIFSNLTEKVTNILVSLEENKAQSDILNPEFSSQNLPAVFPKDHEAIAAFWQIDKESFQRGEYIGVAAIKDSKIYVNVKHLNLQAILQSPYIPLETIVEDIAPPYEPGTLAHLEAIAKECWRWQYASEFKRR